jgi:hypothetical protein
MNTDSTEPAEEGTEPKRPSSQQPRRPSRLLKYYRSTGEVPSISDTNFPTGRLPQTAVPWSLGLVRQIWGPDNNSAPLASVPGGRPARTVESHALWTSDPLTSHRVANVNNGSDLDTISPDGRPLYAPQLISVMPPATRLQYERAFQGRPPLPPAPQRTPSPLLRCRTPGCPRHCDPSRCRCAHAKSVPGDIHTASSPTSSPPPPSSGAALPIASPLRELADWMPLPDEALPATRLSWLHMFQPLTQQEIRLNQMGFSIGIGREDAALAPTESLLNTTELSPEGHPPATRGPSMPSFQPPIQGETRQDHVERNQANDASLSPSAISLPSSRPESATVLFTPTPSPPTPSQPIPSSITESATVLFTPTPSPPTPSRPTTPTFLLPEAPARTESYPRFARSDADLTAANAASSTVSSPATAILHTASHPSPHQNSPFDTTRESPSLAQQRHKGRVLAVNARQDSQSNGSGIQTYLLRTPPLRTDPRSTAARLNSHQPSASGRREASPPSARQRGQSIGRAGTPVGGSERDVGDVQANSSPIALRSTAPPFLAPRFTAPHPTALCSTVPPFTAPHFTGPHSTALRSTAANYHPIQPLPHSTRSVSVTSSHQQGHDRYRAVTAAQRSTNNVGLVPTPPLPTAPFPAAPAPRGCCKGAHHLKCYGADPCCCMRNCDSACRCRYIFYGSDDGTPTACHTHGPFGFNIGIREGFRLRRESWKTVRPPPGIGRIPGLEQPPRDPQTGEWRPVDQLSRGEGLARFRILMPRSPIVG